jgi:microcystin-dependent protein
MAEPFVGQVTMLALPFAPKGYAFCNGQILPITQNQALFALLGVQYGGNGTSNFNLPDLRGRSPVSYMPSVDPSWQPGSYQIGLKAGSETVTLTRTQIPAHVHMTAASTVASTDGEPSDNEALAVGSIPIYTSTITPVPLGGGPLGNTGGGGPHPNMQPFLAINMCIALSGVYPSRS